MNRQPAATIALHSETDESRGSFRTPSRPASIGGGFVFLTMKDWHRVCSLFRRALRLEIRRDQERAREIALRKGRRNEASLVASFRRVRARSTTFNDQVTQLDMKAAEKVARRVK